jgi:hypothetical protein
MAYGYVVVDVDDATRHFQEGIFRRLCVCVCVSCESFFSNVQYDAIIKR